MVNVNQTDVASDQNSGNSISKTVKSGNHSPPSSRLSLGDTPSEITTLSTGPQSDSVSGQVSEGESALTNRTKVSTLKSENEELRSQSIASAVTALNDFVQNERRDLEFSVSEEEGVAVIRIIDRKSGALIREIPGEEVVDLARKLNDKEPLRLFSALI